MPVSTIRLDESDLRYLDEIAEKRLEGPLVKASLNASPLIFLAKMDKLYCLKLYKIIHTTDPVIKEIDRGLQKGYSEAMLIRKMIDDRKIVEKN